ncbi:hypothetical protein [Roseivirga pacifica]|uniref:hypothetical protein n=1 Tax=Roseivirga pacifica TaxID=1267423 RepID=UPI003BAD3545
MKNLLNILLVLGCFVALNTNSQAQSSAIFIEEDISGSVELTEEQSKKEETYIKRYLLPKLNFEPVIISVGFLFANSGSVLNNRTIEYEPKGSGNENQQNKFLAINKVIKTLKANTSRSNQTQILATLKTISKAASEHKSVSVLWLTDALESSKIRELKLYSLQDAKQKGETDAKKIMALYSLEKNTSAKVDFTCLLPLSQTDEKREYQFIEEYWTTVLSHFFENFTLKFELL